MFACFLTPPKRLMLKSWNFDGWLPLGCRWIQAKKLPDLTNRLPKKKNQSMYAADNWNAPAPFIFSNAMWMLHATLNPTEITMPRLNNNNNNENVRSKKLLFVIYEISISDDFEWIHLAIKVIFGEKSKKSLGWLILYWKLNFHVQSLGYIKNF